MPLLISSLIKIFELVLAGVVAGLLGALVGLGGGVVLTPVLTLFLNVPVMYAAGASLVSTIATSAGSASVYIRKRIANDRIGVSLMTATTTGAITGSLTVNYVYSHGLTWIIYVIFGLVLIISIIPTVQRSTCELPPPKNPDKTTVTFRLYGVCYDPALGVWYRYWGVRWWLGELIMFFAGFISGLLGIGSGALKVLAMDWAMNLPVKVSTTTSNFMIGVTAATSSSLYWAFGYINPIIATCTAIGVLLGSRIGTRVLMHATNRQVRWVFTAILTYFGLRMTLRGLSIEDLLPITPIERNVVSAVIASVVILALIIISKARGAGEDYVPQLYKAQPEVPGKIEARFIDVTSNILKYGVLVSVTLLILGLMIIIIHGGSASVHLPLSKMLDPSSHVDTSNISIMQVLVNAFRLDGLSIMLLGLLALIMIPILMMIINLTRFILEHDSLYIIFTAITLINLMIALIILPMFIHR